jgi:acetate kinase
LVRLAFSYVLHHGFAWCSAVFVPKLFPSAYVALLGGVDILVFTGGIGEHSDYVRSAVTNGLEFLGLTADKIKCVPDEEEQQIARHCRRMIEQPL